MAYRISGLSPEPFLALAAMDDAELAGRRARRTVAAGPGFPCRVTLEEAAPGEALLLVNHVSHDAPTPFRASHAIYVREGAREAAALVDEVPAIFATRTLGLRGFDEEGMLRDARLAPPATADAGIRALFADPESAEIHAHNAALGCFLARIARG